MREREYAVSITGCYPECELPVMVTEAGKATNHFSDGTRGVPAEWASYAEEIFDGEHASIDLDTGEWSFP